MSAKINFDTANVEYFQIEESDLLDDDFESDIDEFTQYYHMECLSDVRERIVHAYFIKVDGVNMGYVTLAMAHIRNNATEAIKSKEINGNVPALLISHIAVRKNNQRRGIGRALLDLVFVHLVPELTNRAGCRYVMLNPRDDQEVRDFYTNYGFEYYPNFVDDKESDACLYDLKINRN